jgi:hypothetical protein
VGVIAEELGVLVPWEETAMREISYLVGVAVKRRDRKAKAGVQF